MNRLHRLRLRIGSDSEGSLLVQTLFLLQDAAQRDVLHGMGCAAIQGSSTAQGCRRIERRRLLSRAFHSREGDCACRYGDRGDRAGSLGCPVRTL